MNKIVIQNITIKNFLSIGQQTTFDFASHHDLNYVFGNNKDIEGVKNGAGKTLIFCDAILFALFGQTSRRVTLKYIPNRQMPRKTETIVSLNLLINDVLYTATSGINYGLPFFRLFKGTSDITKSSIKETRTYFEREILKISYNIFKNSVILSSSNSSNFFGLSKAQRREFVEDIFDLNIFGDMLRMVRADINNLDREILSLQTTTKQLSSSLDELKVNDANFSKQKDKNVTDLTTKIDGKKKRIDELIIEIANDTKAKSELKFENLVVLNEQLGKYKSGKERATFVIKSAEKEIKHSVDSIAKHKVVMEEICQDCRIKLENKLEISKLNSIVETENKNIETYKQVIAKLDSEISTLTIQVSAINASKTKHDTLDKNIQHNNIVVEHLRSDIKELEEKLVKEQASQTVFGPLIADYTEKVRVNNEILSGFNDKRKYMDVLTHVVDEDGAKKYIIKDLIIMLNSRIRKYLNESGAAYTCIFDTGFNCEFITTTGPCSYENFSMGEQGRIDISVLFAFKDILNSLKAVDINILVLDEFLDSSLDTFAVNALIKIVKQICEQSNKTIFLISHRECIDSDDFDGIIEVQKSNGLTSVINDSQMDALHIK